MAIKIQANPTSNAYCGVLLPHIENHWSDGAQHCYAGIEPIFLWEALQLLKRGALLFSVCLLYIVIGILLLCLAGALGIS